MANKGEYLSNNKFILRTPLLPLNFIRQFINSQQDLIDVVIKYPVILTAIYVASPILYQDCVKLINNEINNEKRRKKIVISITKYLLRMCTRSTPFGLFAGCTYGKLDAKTEIILFPQSRYTFKLTFQMTYLFNLAKYLASHASIKRQIKFYMNNTLYSVMNEFRYFKYNSDSNQLGYEMQKVPKSEILNILLKESEEGVLIEDLEKILKSKNFNDAEINYYINELINHQILISEFNPNLTGINFFDNAIIILNSIRNKNDEILMIEKTLRNVNELMKDSRLLEEIKDLQYFHNLKIFLNELPVKYLENKLFHIDLAKPSKLCIIGNDSIMELIDVIKIISVFNNYPVNEDIESFKKAFRERYIDEEIPLAIALDPELGVGYPVGKFISMNNNLIEDVDLEKHDLDNVNNELKWSFLQSYYFKKYWRAFKDGKYSVDINDIDLEALLARYRHLEQLSNNISIVVKKFRENDKEYNYIKYVNGVNAVGLIARFCHLDEKFEELAKEICLSDIQSNSDAILADIIHLPEPKIGNILQRPILYNYEIPFFSKSLLHSNNQIHLNDIYISMKGDSIILKSKKHNCEVIPRLSNAHNYLNSNLPIYRFLCDLQGQGLVSDFGFDWGVLGNKYKFAPRVYYKNTIIRLATWALNDDDLYELMEANQNDWFKELNKLRSKYMIPRYVAIADNDNELMLDLEKDLCLEIFMDELKKKYRRGKLKLIEFLFTEDNLIINDCEDKFVNEFVFFFQKDDFRSNAINARHNFSDNLRNFETKRNYVPGEEWIYYKFYCGYHTIEEIIIKLLKPLSDLMIKEDLLEKWFFVRYKDSNGIHLRVRYKLRNKSNLVNIYEKINFYINPYINSKKIWKVQIDTYQREIERYSEDLMDFSESIFFIDSVSILRLINIINQNNNSNLRWIIGIKSVDKLLNDFNLSLVQKLEHMILSRTYFESEFNSHGNSKYEIDKKYRQHTLMINGLLTSDNLSNLSKEWIEIYSVLNYRSLKIKQLISETKHDESIFKLNLSDYIHMHLNRLFMSESRKYEFMINEMLLRYYKSELAKKQ